MMESDVEGGRGTRHSQRARTQTYKVIDAKKTGGRSASVHADPFASRESTSNQLELRQSESESVEVRTPRAPRTNRVRKINDNAETLATILHVLQRLEASHTELKADYERLKTDYTELKQGNLDLKAGNVALKAGNDALMASNADLRASTEGMRKEMADVKAQLADTKTQLAEVVSFTSNLSSSISSGGGSSGSARVSQKSYASALARSINPSSSASQPMVRVTSTGGAASSIGQPGVNIDTRRIKDKSIVALDNIASTEKRLKDTVKAVDLLKEAKIVGMQVRGHNVRVLTGTEREATLLRTNDAWVSDVFEGARTRGEEWHPVKLDDAVKAVVIGEDGHNIKNDFAEKFCAENGVTEVMKTFWLSKGNKPTGSMAVFLASAEDAQRLIHGRLVKIGAQVAFASEFHKLPRPIRCYNCNQYGHYQSRCVLNTTCGKCSRDHRTDSCTATEKKCPACGLAHTVTDPGCPVYKREKANLIRASRQLESPVQTLSSDA
jgi:hypothetical protein